MSRIVDMHEFAAVRSEERKEKLRLFPCRLFDIEKNMSAPPPTQSTRRKIAVTIRTEKEMGEKENSACVSVFEESLPAVSAQGQG